MASRYASSVFFNCPFDDEYLALRNAILFAIFDCGFVPRSALEVDDSGEGRFDKIQRLIAESKYAVHDICRTELDPSTKLPRFNMPLELGVFIGAKRFGANRHKQKSCLILDREKYRYQAFVSDIAGHDIRSHDGLAENAIRHVRNWLNSASGRKTIPGGSETIRRYRIFCGELPEMCQVARIALDELTYNDYWNFMSEWLEQNATL